MALTVRPLTLADRADWQPLWQSYLAFYRTTLPQAQFDLTWARLHDEREPMFALGAFEGERLLGIAHGIYHRSCWSAEPSCYLQDLFTHESARGHGVGRALIEALCARAKADGANRVHWLTHETNAEAMVLYNKLAERSGFVQYRKLL